MRYSLKLITFASVLLFTFPLQAVVTNGLSVASEEVKVAQGKTREQRRNEALRVNKLGLQQLDRGKYREALKNFEQALVIVREIEERKDEGTTLNNIGNVYHNSGEYKKALDYYQQALAIDKQIVDKVGESITLNNIGEVYRELGEYAKALDY